MQCPIDGTELKMTAREGVEIDYCPKCRGVWLDRGELDKIIDRVLNEMAGPDGPGGPGDDRGPPGRGAYPDDRQGGGYPGRYGGGRGEMEDGPPPGQGSRGGSPWDDRGGPPGGDTRGRPYDDRPGERGGDDRGPPAGGRGGSILDIFRV